MTETRDETAPEISPEMQAALDGILPKLDSLAQMLQVDDPGIQNYMLDIKEDLNQYPQLTYLLTDEQISPIYMGLQKVEQVQIKIKTARKKKQNNILPDGTSVADLL